MSVKKVLFGEIPNGGIAYKFIIENKNGMIVEVSNYGALILSLWVKDKQQVLQDIVLGYDTLSQYLDNHPMFGACVGRCVNRISNASFSIDGHTYTLLKNRGSHNIHSDKDHGFHKVLWEYAITDDHAVNFRYVSQDGELGFPGTVHVSITYTLSEANGLILSYYATTDKKTMINLSNHSYFNLRGHSNADILDTEFFINAKQYTPIDDEILPTGCILEVKNTPMDFTKYVTIQDRVHLDVEQVKIESGYDHNFVISSPHSGIRIVSGARNKSSGICMNVYSDLPGLQFYTSNSLQATKGKHNTIYNTYSGFCMEPQFFPNSINIDSFESPLFTKEKVYKYTTIYQFY